MRGVKTNCVFTFFVPLATGLLVVQAIDKIIALCYDKMCEAVAPPVVEIGDDSEDTQEQEDLDWCADLISTRVDTQTPGGAVPPVHHFECGTEKKSAAEGGRLVFSVAPTPPFSF